MYRILLRTMISLFTAVIILLYSHVVSAQTAQEYYQQGLELKKQEKYREAVDVFEKAIVKDRRFAEAYYEMGIAFQNIGTPSSRKRAEDAFLNALKEGSDDIKYLSALAVLYEKMLFNPLAKSTWQRVLDIDSTSTDALLGFARAHKRDADANRFRVDPYTPNEFIEDLLDVVEPKHFFYDTNFVNYQADLFGDIFNVKALLYGKENELARPLRWDKYTEKSDSTAMDFYNRILETDPVNRDALFGKGLIYFNTAEYQYSMGLQVYDGYVQDESGLEQFAAMFEDLVENYPDDKDGHLFLGLAYHRQREYEKALREFSTARNLMDDEEKEVFDNVAVLQTDGFRQTEMVNADDIDKNYWQRKDPLILSSYNERQLEHYSRVAEAALRWTIPRQGIEGWKTDQGKILIKYGSPKNQVKYRNSSVSLGADFRMYDYWHYSDFAFVFEKQLGVEYDNFNLSIWDDLNFSEILEDVEKEHPDFYEYKPKGRFINASYDHAVFRGEDGKTQIEVYYGIPFNTVIFSEEGDYYYGSFRAGIFVRDSLWNPIVDDINDLDIELEVVNSDTSSDDLAVYMSEFQVDPDSYILGFEILDHYSENIGTFRSGLAAREFGFEELQISDIQVANNIQLLDSSLPVTRDNLEIAPNPPRFFRQEQPIFIYSEIYNLFLDGMQGSTDYSVKYSLQYRGEDNYNVLDLVKDIFVNEQKVRDVTTEINMRGRRQNESIFLKIEHNLTETGEYALTLEVTDNIAGTIVNNVVFLRIFE
ncbi:GWxTD domain-containing protein [candidate division KSB1 bacterium]